MENVKVSRGVRLLALVLRFLGERLIPRSLLHVEQLHVLLQQRHHYRRDLGNVVLARDFVGSRTVLRYYVEPSGRRFARLRVNLKDVVLKPLLVLKG